MGWVGVLWGTGSGCLWQCWEGGLPWAASSSPQYAAVVGSAGGLSLSQQCAPTEPLLGPSGSVGSTSCSPCLTPWARTWGVKAGTQGKLVCTLFSVMGRRSSAGTWLLWEGSLVTQRTVLGTRCGTSRPSWEVQGSPISLGSSEFAVWVCPCPVSQQRPCDSQSPLCWGWGAGGCGVRA